MMGLELVIVVVGVLALMFGLFAICGMVERPSRVRRGDTWIDHPEDLPLSERPSD